MIPDSTSQALACILSASTSLCAMLLLWWDKKDLPVSGSLWQSQWISEVYIAGCV